MAGVPPIAIVIAEKAQLYKRKHYMEGAAYEYDSLYRSQSGHTLLGEQT